jgi:hypothetical protein
MTATISRRPDNWIELLNTPQKEMELAELHASKNRGRPYGATDWAIETACKLGVESSLRPENSKGTRSNYPESRMVTIGSRPLRIFLCWIKIHVLRRSRRLFAPASVSYLDRCCADEFGISCFLRYQIEQLPGPMCDGFLWPTLLANHALEFCLGDGSLPRILLIGFLSLPHYPPNRGQESWSCTSAIGKR